MALIEELLPWDSQPQEAVGVDWSHDFFAGATSAIVFHGGERTVHRRGGEPQLFGSSGSWSDSVGPVGRAVTTTAGSLVQIAPTLQALTTVLVIGSARVFNTENGLYYSYRYLSPGGVSFGDGADASASNRRDWSWSQPNFFAPFCVVPNQSMVTAPEVYVAGASALVSSGGGTATSYSWGTATTYFGPGSNFATDPCVLLVAVDWRPPSDVAARASANPWQLLEPRRDMVPVSAGAPSLPTLSLPTYVPGSLTSVGFRPRVTAS